MKHTITASLWLALGLLFTHCGHPTTTPGQSGPKNLQSSLPPQGLIIVSNTGVRTLSNANAFYGPPDSCSYSGPADTSYTITISDDSHASYLQFRAHTVPQINQTYDLTIVEGSSLSDASQETSVVSVAVDNTAPLSLDALREAKIRFYSAPQSTTGDLAFAFLVSYQDGKSISGTANIALTDMTHNPCPSN